MAFLIFLKNKMRLLDDSRTTRLRVVVMASGKTGGICGGFEKCEK